MATKTKSGNKQTVHVVGLPPSCVMIRQGCSIHPLAFLAIVLAAGGLALSYVYVCKNEAMTKPAKIASVETSYTPSNTYDDCHLENEKEMLCKGYWMGFAKGMSYAK